MTRSNYLSLLIGMNLLLPSIQDASAQACADASGTWVDADHWAWTFGQEPNGKISGVHGQGAGGTCTNGQAYTITAGGYTGGGNFTATATQTAVAAGGSPVNGCPVHKFISGTLEQPGCDHARVSVSSDGVGTGAQLWTQTCLLPPTETTVWDSWNLVDYEPLVAVFEATLQSPFSHSFNFGGRTILETFPQGGKDDCWFENQTTYRKFTPKAHAAHVIAPDAGNRYPDHVGPEEGDSGHEADKLIAFYRQHNRTPCSFTAVQKMTLDCSSGGQTVYNPNGNELVITIGDSTIKVWRSGVPSPEKAWGTSKAAYRAIFFTTIALQLLHSRPH